MHVLEERLADAALIMEWWSATYLKAALGRYIILPFIKIFCRRSQESRVYQSSVVNILQSGEEKKHLHLSYIICHTTWGIQCHPSVTLKDPS